MAEHRQKHWRRSFGVSATRSSWPSTSRGEAFNMSGVTRTVYLLRYGGASQDASSGRRKLEEIRRRGNWAVMISFQKYEKSGRATLLMESIGRFNHNMGKKFLAEGAAELRLALLCSQKIFHSEAAEEIALIRSN